MLLRCCWDLCLPKPLHPSRHGDSHTSTDAPLPLGSGVWLGAGVGVKQGPLARGWWDSRTGSAQPWHPLIQWAVGAKCQHGLQKPSHASWKPRHCPDPAPSTTPWTPVSPVQEWAQITPPAGVNPGETASAELCPPQALSSSALSSSREPAALEHPAHVAGPRGRWAEVGRGWDAAKGALLARAPNPAPSHTISTHSPPKPPFHSLGAARSAQALLGSNRRLEMGSLSYRQADVALPWSCQSLSQAQLKSAEQRGRIQPPNSKCSHSSCPVWSMTTSPRDSQHSCDPTGGDKGTLSPLPPYPGPSEGHSIPRSRIWGGMRVSVPGMLLLLLPAAVEPLARGGERAKGSMWGKPARGKIDI